MKPYGVDQPYIEPTSYTNGVVLPTGVNTYVTAQPYGEAEPYTGGASEELEPSVPVTAPSSNVDPYIVANPYIDGSAYGDSAVSFTHNAGNILHFNDTSTIDGEQSVQSLTFSQETIITHSAENVLTFSYDFNSDGNNLLAFSQEAIFEHKASNELSFTQGAVTSNLGTDVLTFTQVADFQRAPNQLLTFTQAAEVTRELDNSLTLTGTASVLHAVEDVLSFSELTARQVAPINLLSFTQTANGLTSPSAGSSVTFTSTVTWNITRTKSATRSLRLSSSTMYQVVHNGVPGDTGGSIPAEGAVPRVPRRARDPSFNKTPPLPRVTIGGREFRVNEDYTLMYSFDNGKYMNLGTRYTIELDRLCADIDTWQEALRLLIGQLVTVEGLLIAPFEAFVTDESTLSIDGISLVVESTAYDPRGLI